MTIVIFAVALKRRIKGILKMQLMYSELSASNVSHKQIDKGFSYFVMQNLLEILRSSPKAIIQPCYYLVGKIYQTNKCLV